jgi:hypothetical protein
LWLESCVPEYGSIVACTEALGYVMTLYQLSRSEILVIIFSTLVETVDFWEPQTALSLSVSRTQAYCSETWPALPPNCTHRPETTFSRQHSGMTKDSLRVMSVPLSGELYNELYLENRTPVTQLVQKSSALMHQLRTLTSYFSKIHFIIILSSTSRSPE